MDEAGMNKALLAGKLGVSEQTVYCYLTGERKPKRWMVHAMATILKCKTYELLDEVE